jgi:hypothetical protein
MDKHIKTLIVDNINTNTKETKMNKMISEISPSDGFENYSNLYKDLILQEIMKEKYDINREDVENIMARFKKTYKNRFYRIRTALHKND